MSKGISLHIGINVVDSSHYGSDLRLHGCVNDANAMHALADSKNFESSILLDSEATTRNVVNAITKAAGILQAGDIFLMTYSGHGGQLWDSSGDDPDGKDETLVLFDRHYRDDEFNRQLARFVSGVRILWVSDSCHATNNFRELGEDESAPPPPRTLGLDKSEEIVKNNKGLYNEVQEAAKDFLKENTPKMEASLLQLAACKEQQLSGDAFPDDLNPMGVFTGHLLQVWDNGQFSGTYQQLIDVIVQGIPADSNQTPQLVVGGQANAEFAEQRPFEI